MSTATSSPPARRPAERPPGRLPPGGLRAPGRGPSLAFARDAMALFTGSALGGVLAIAGLALLSRELPLGDFGTLSLALATAHLTRPLLNLGLGSALVQRSSVQLARGEEGAAFGTMQVATVARLAVVGTILLLMWPLGSVLAAVVFDDAALAAPFRWGIAIGALMSLRMHVEAILQARQAFVWAAVANATRFGGQFLLIVLLVSAGRVDLHSVLAVYLLTPVLFILVAAPRLPLARMATTRPSYRTEGTALFGVASWVALMLATNEIGTQIDVPVIRYYLTSEDVGQYYAAYQVMGAIALIGGAIGSVLLPYASRLATRDHQALTRTPDLILTRVALIAMPLMLAGWMLAPTIVDLVWGAQFDRAQGVMRLLLPGAFAALLTMGTGQLLLATGHTRPLVPLALLNLVTNLVLLFALVPTIGIEGAAIATSVSYWLVLVAIWAITYRHLGVSPRLGGLVPSGLAGVAMAGAMAGLVGALGTGHAARMLAVAAGLLVYLGAAFALHRSAFTRSAHEEMPS